MDNAESLNQVCILAAAPYSVLSFKNSAGGISGGKGEGFAVERPECPATLHTHKVRPGGDFVNSEVQARRV
jgi:hypothetical protein